MSTPDDEAVAASHAVMARHARSFRLASWFLAPEVRDDAALLYAFCRAVDDAADDAPSTAEAVRQLEALEADLRSGGPSVAGRVHTLASRRGLPLEAAFELIEGARSDLGVVRVADDEALVRYAYLVAGTVGSMMCALLGARHPRAQQRAVDLGIGMQITNICRDVKEDAGIGRVYLPASRLAALGTDAGAILDGTAPRAAVSQVVAGLLDLADRYYASADVGVRDLPARARLAVLVASRVYRAIGVELRARGCDPMAGRVIVSPLGKAKWAGRAGIAWLGITAGLEPWEPSPRGSGAGAPRPSVGT